MPPSFLRDQVARRILDGDNLVVYRGHLLNIPKSWLDAHPGGDLAILHFVGRDASDEIEASHHPDTLRSVMRFSIGTVDVSKGGWDPLMPPIARGWVRRNGRWERDASELLDLPSQPASSVMLKEKSRADMDALGPTMASLQPPRGDLALPVQTRHSKAYRQLHQRIIDAGLYDTPYLTGYGPEVFRYLFLASSALYAYKHSWFITSAIFLGLTWHQLVFTAHDLGHMGVTHNWAKDRIIATIIADFIGGLSIGWWVQNHNVHHLVTNHPSHDPDIQHMPFIAISPVFLESLWSTYYKRVLSFDRFAKIMLALQHKLFYIIMMFGRFNLYVNSYVYLYQKGFDTRRARGGKWAWRLEVAGIIFFWSWFGAVLYGCGSWKNALVYLLVSHVVTSPLHVQIVLSHFSMSTEDLGPVESFPHRQLRTTSDVICSDSVAFIHGGLHLQVTHHLFPRLPRHNLRKASALVKKFAKEEGLTYAEFGFVDGNKDVIGVLADVARQVKIVGTVAKAEAKEAVSKKVAAADARFLKANGASIHDH